MIQQDLNTWFDKVIKKYPHLRRENFNRLVMLFYGVNYKNQDSYPDPFTHYEVVYTAKRLSNNPVLTFFQPESPFTLLDTGAGEEKILLYHGKFVDNITDFEKKSFDMKREEPFYFYVREIKGELVLKLNPIQLCDFFQNSKGLKPCSFCFRNDMVSRFRNISAEKLVELVIKNEKDRDNLQTLQSIDELSIVTGSYINDDEYAKEISTLVKGIKPLIAKDLRVVVGSHEGKTRNSYQKLKEAGVTVFAFPIESLDDNIRKKNMQNRKGMVSIKNIIKYIEDAVDIFGEEGVIIRLVAGMGDMLDEHFRNKVKNIASLGKVKGPYWNINEYMPFTHYHWKLFRKKRPYSLNYLFAYCNIINTFVPTERQIRFKVSP